MEGCFAFQWGGGGGGGRASFFSFKWGSLLDISVQAAQIGHEFLRLVFSVYTKVDV